MDKPHPNAWQLQSGTASATVRELRRWTYTFNYMAEKVSEFFRDNLRH